MNNKKVSCTVIISHFNSLVFLRRCVHQVRKHQHPQVDVHIIISDQSSDENHELVQTEFSNQKDITIVRTKSLYSGYGIDYIMRYVDIKSDFICQLHADAFPIHDNWLSAPIRIMIQYCLSFSGVLQFICDKPEPIYYYKKSFFSMAQSFHIGRTDIYKEMSMNGGFTRYHNRPFADIPMQWANDDWDTWAKEDYQARGSDDDVPAFCYQDNYRNDHKLGLGLTGRIGVKGEESGYGSIIEDLVFHFGFHREALGVMNEMGERYRKWTERINAGFTDELFEELLAKARENPLDPKTGRTFWHGIKKEACSLWPVFHERIECAKKGMGVTWVPDF